MRYRENYYSYGLASLLLLLFLVATTPTSANTHSCPIAVSSGQPACTESRDLGSNTPPRDQSRHVGNPIDVISGNKYQSELDIQLGGSDLALTRHYNSVSSAANLGLGNGWRHTYSVVLLAEGDGIRRIVQSDGRQLEFAYDGTVYVSLSGNDGYVVRQSGDRHTWHLPDGRVLAFYGSFLTELSSSGGSVLTLYYRRSRLYSVTDQLGRSLVFRYAPGKIGLPSYETADSLSPAGHLTSIELPDGSEIRYRYDNRHNLASVSYPKNGTREYGYIYRYQDISDSSLLTERADGYGKALARWTYDETSRVNSYRKGTRIRHDGSDSGPPDLALSYAAGDDVGSGITVVTGRDGAQTEYLWSLDNDNQVREISERNDGRPATMPEQTQRELGHTVDDQNQIQGTQSDDVLTILELDELGYPSWIGYQPSGASLPDLLSVSYNQVGVLVDVNWQKGQIQAVNNERPVTRQELKEFVNTNWGDSAKIEEILSAVAQRGFIESSAKRFLNDTTTSLEKGAKISGADLSKEYLSAGPDGADPRPVFSPNETGHPYTTPCVDPLKDCDELLRARDYAEIADCAYVTSNCDTRFFEANLDDLGVDWDILVDGSFRAGIYHDRFNDEYIVTFAGTSFTSIGDWVNNAQQELGEHAEQYDLAVELARLLTRNNPNSTFRFTGHSLGGGLATAAAAATGQEAVVFNPAALSPETAHNYGFSYSGALRNTEVFSVEGELLSHVQSEFAFTNEVQGNIHLLQRPQFSWVQENVSQNPLWAYNTRLGIALHGIDAVRRSLSELIERYRCQ